MVELSVETEKHSNCKSYNCDGNSILYRKENPYVNYMLIKDEERFNLLEKLLSEPDDIKESISFHRNEGEAVKCNQQVVNGRGEIELDRNFIISMAKENIQQLVVSGVQLRAKCKEEIEKLWMKKSVKKRTNKEEKLTKEIYISKERGQQQHNIWKPGRTKAIVTEEMK